MEPLFTIIIHTNTPVAIADTLHHTKRLPKTPPLWFYSPLRHQLGFVGTQHQHCGGENHHQNQEQNQNSCRTLHFFSFFCNINMFKIYKHTFSTITNSNINTVCCLCMINKHTRNSNRSSIWRQDFIFFLFPFFKFPQTRQRISLRPGVKGIPLNSGNKPLKTIHTLKNKITTLLSISADPVGVTYPLLQTSFIYGKSLQFCSNKMLTNNKDFRSDRQEYTPSITPQSGRRFSLCFFTIPCLTNWTGVMGWNTAALGSHSVPSPLTTTTILQSGTALSTNTYLPVSVNTWANLSKWELLTQTIQAIKDALSHESGCRFDSTCWS